MEPTRDVECTLVDIIDRILDKGVILNADVIISVAGIPLIGINLRAALAGIETMLDYGMMEAWDESTRKYYAKEYAERIKPPLLDGEEILFHAVGSYHYSEGIYSAWQLGSLFLTDKRIFLFRKEPPEILFETKLERIKGLMKKREHHLGKERENLCLLLDENKVMMLHTENMEELKKAIEKQAEIIGVHLKEPTDILLGEKPLFLTKNENIIQTEKVWYLLPASGILGETWKSGKMYITDKRVCWCYDFGEKPVFDIPIDSIADLSVKRENMGNMLKNEWALTLSYKNGTTVFLGKEEKLNSLKMAVKAKIPLPVKH